MPNITKQIAVEALLTLATEFGNSSSQNIERAKELQSLGVSNYDALHIAIAESMEADYLLTTDDKFIAKTSRLDKGVIIQNPLQFITGEILQ
jgi:predicted nucleic acid-binding protein